MPKDIAEQIQTNLSLSDLGQIGCFEFEKTRGVSPPEDFWELVNTLKFLHFDSSFSWFFKNDLSVKIISLNSTKNKILH